MLGRLLLAFSFLLLVDECDFHLSPAGSYTNPCQRMNFSSSDIDFSIPTGCKLSNPLRACVVYWGCGANRS